MFESAEDFLSKKFVLKSEIEAAVARHILQTIAASLLGGAAFLAGLQALLRYRGINPDLDLVLGTISALVAVTGTIMIIIALRRQSKRWRELLDDFIDRAEAAFNATHDRVAGIVIVDKLSQGLYFDEARRLLSASSDGKGSPVDDFALTRSFLKKFLKERPQTPQEPCLSFQRMPQIDLMTTSQLQVIAMQVRLCMNVATQLHSVQPFGGHSLYTCLHKAAVRNFLAQTKGKKQYAPNYYFGSRMALDENDALTIVGLIRILFWSRDELVALHSQQYIDVWEAFGIPTFWIERSRQNCKKLWELGKQRGPMSAVFKLFTEGAKADPDRWTREADFFTVGDSVVKGYRPDPNGSDLNWRNEGQEFAQFFAEIATVCEDEVFYAKEASWRLHANGAAIDSAGKRHGFVLENDYLAFETHRTIEKLLATSELATGSIGGATTSPAGAVIATRS